MHPALEHVQGLIGTWKGTAVGVYPTITDFQYADTWEFRDIGKPFLVFEERTLIGTNPAHTEMGYLRFPTPETVELVAAIPSGQSELAEGTCRVGEDGTIRITVAGDVRNTSTAKTVNRIERIWTLDGDRLTYEMNMAAVGQEMHNHLRVELARS